MVIAVRHFRAGVPIFLLAAGHWYAEAATRITPTFLKSSKDLGDVARTCDVDAVQDANVQQLHPILHDLVNTTFFRLFRVNLKNPSCPYWKTKQDEKEDGGGGTCGGGAAAPAAPFLKSALFSSAADEPSEPPCSVDSEDGSVDMLDRSMNLADKIASDKRNNESEFDCEFEEDLPTYWVDMCGGDSTTSGGVEDVNLIKNPERNTGYNGRHIWEAMYQENCFEVGNSLPRGRYSEVATAMGMCYEERVLYRLLSGWHASTTLSIVKNYYAPGTKKKKEWAPNLDRFMQDLGSQPERVKNLHFSFVVMLRAVKKAGPMLLKYPYSTGSEKEDSVTKTLMSRLLDSQVLSLCSPLFDAFDETRLFVSSTSPQQRSQLKRQFKSVFRNITVLVDCVQCQRCRLHAKLYSLGLGTALKILLTPQERIATSTTRDEVVALVHVLWKLSEAMQDAGELTELYYKDHAAGTATAAQAAPAGGLLEESRIEPVVAGAAASPPPAAYDRTGLLDIAFGAVRKAGTAGGLSAQEEEAALRFLVLQPAREEILLLAKHYAQARPDVFARTLLEAASAAGVSVVPSAVAAGRVAGPPLLGTRAAPADAVIIGGGLAGMVACMSLLDRGATVVMIEKQAYLGGNSGKASSGINAALETTVESLVSDTTRSAGALARPELIGKLANDSASAVGWLRDRTGVDLSMRSQLGGHSVKRTLRPNNAFVGAEITASTSRILSKFASEHPEQFRILTKAKWLGLEQGGAGWRVTVQANATEAVLEAASTVIASGGFGHDRKEAESLLLRFRPDLEDFPTTLGPQTTGDGVKIARDLGAKLVDMDRVQLHPTGFVNPEKPEDHTKTLAAELLRGVGGLLLDVGGRRFTNELGTRQAVVNAELEVAKAGRSLKPPAPLRATSLVLNGKAAAMADRHVALYSSKGLLRKVAGLGGLAAHLGVPVQSLRETFDAYNKAAEFGQDEFGRTVFPAGHWPIEAEEDFFVGQVVPVIHYTMGGIAINPQGQVLRPDNTTIPSLYAIGEASGGVHGDNRLAGNSLLECTVFGRHVGLSIPIQSAKPSSQPISKAADPVAPVPAPLELSQPRKISRDELKQHNARGLGNWVALYGQVYELADYVDEHPGGAEAILDVGGEDGTTKFEAVHNRELLESMGFTPIGVLEG